MRDIVAVSFATKKHGAQHVFGGVGYDLSVLNDWYFGLCNLHQPVQCLRSACVAPIQARGSEGRAVWRKGQRNSGMARVLIRNRNRSVLDGSGRQDARERVPLKKTGCRIGVSDSIRHSPFFNRLQRCTVQLEGSTSKLGPCQNMRIFFLNRGKKRPKAQLRDFFGQ